MTLKIPKMKEPHLIIMAAGMGSRYGGLKQIDPITREGEIIMDFSLYDAMMAGFKKVVFVIRQEMEEDFRALMDDRAGKYMEVNYAFQKIDDLPDGFEVPTDRSKPWGTGHAILAARHIVDGPFAVINADDYYGPGGFQLMYDFLTKQGGANDFCMIGYHLKNTITENGHVSRGVCNVNKDDYLVHVTERTKIQRVEDKICYTEDEGTSWTELPEDAPVSMNFWGYTHLMMEELKKRFVDFLKEEVPDNPAKAEYLLPKITDQLITEGKADVRVRITDDRWYGITYKEDKEAVMAALQSMKDKGLYPDKLWQ